MTYQRVGVVTGANKGIGLAIVRQLALQYPKSPYNNGPLLIYLTARDKGRGEQAVKDIEGDAQLKKAKALSSDGGLSDVRYHQLDISETKSIQDFAAYLKKEHPDGIDFAINNAGIALQGFDVEVVKNTLGCNYYGTLEATQEFLPLIKDGGRLVNVTSTAGKLSKYSSELQERFRSAKEVNDVTKLMEDFTAAVEAGNEKEQGWTSAAYAASKAGATIMSRAIAEKHRASGSKTLINACCPGYVNTDMTRGAGTKIPDQGAQTPVMLAISDIQGQNGLFWKSEKPEEF
ncbi:carbonyl reductase [Tothia fuscella]|uniref:Carbonyl reductase n=1 Tax=Tothia fuscella TaxID=1048955 RepID=A0A9P4U4B2_9PEZI|nr:carbonyl reductase [Tothia fuscella]